MILIMSSMRRIEIAASVAKEMLFSLISIGSSTPALTLSRSLPLVKSRPVRPSATLELAGSDWNLW